MTQNMSPESINDLLASVRFDVHNAAASPDPATRRFAQDVRELDEWMTRTRGGLAPTAWKTPTAQVPTGRPPLVFPL